ncbi:MAG: polysaccharide biosynthesis C-terminal domain-containing protein, partial [Candidatus Methanoperedens sp.]
TLFNILATVINAAGRPKIPMFIAAALIPVAIGLNSFLIPAYHLAGAAMATTITGLAGLILVSVYVLKEFGVLMEIASFTKMLFASLVVFIIILAVPVSGLILPLWYALLFGIYLSVLILIKEFNKNELEILARILTKRDG